MAVEAARATLASMQRVARASEATNASLLLLGRGVSRDGFATFNANLLHTEVTDEAASAWPAVNFAPISVPKPKASDGSVMSADST